MNDTDWILKDNYNLRKMSAGKSEEIRLSVLICTIPERAKDFDALWDHLYQQLDSLWERWKAKIEIIAISDERRMTIGAKRNMLLDHSEGAYVCFIDDDDNVSDIYLNKLYEATRNEPHAIAFDIECRNYYGPGRSKMATVGLGNVWREDPDRIHRPAYHKTPVRADIAKAAGFPDKSYGEDAEYSKRIAKAITDIHYIPETLYYYNTPTVTKNRYKQKK